MEKAYAIRVSSQKGGVGKTTVAVNLAVALGMLNYSVLLVDADLESPAVGIFLGMESVNIGITDVISGKADLQRAIIKHHVSRIKVLPGTLASDVNPTESEMRSLLEKILALKDYDFVIVDTPPGTAFHKLVELFDEALIITTPTMTSITNSIKLDSIYNKSHVVHSLVVNRVSSKGYQLSTREMEEGYGSRPIVSLPEDHKVQLSESQHIPVWILDRSTPFCQSLNVLVKFYAAKKGSSMDREPVAEKGIRAVILQIVKRLLGLSE